MRLSVLTRYLIRIHVGPFLFALCAITGLIFLNAVAQRVNDLVGKGLPLQVILEFLVLTLPHTIALSLPMSVLVAVLYAFSDMTASNEITAMSAGGIRPRRVMVPLLLMGAFMSCVMLVFNDRILPESNHALKNLLLDIGRKSPTLELQEQIVNEIRSQQGSARYFLTAQRIDRGTNTLEEVAIYDTNDRANQRTTYAERGHMAFNESRTDLFLTLYDGVVHEARADQPGGFQRVYFERQVVPLRDVGNELERQLGGSDRSDREMGFALLAQNARQRRGELARIRAESVEQMHRSLDVALGIAGPEADSLAAVASGTLGVRGVDQATQDMVLNARSRLARARGLDDAANRYEVEIHKKLAIALACMVFTLMGPPLALRFPRGGVGLVVAASTVIFAVYWVGLIMGEDLADRGVADPALTMWMSNLVFLVVGLLLVRRMGASGGTVRGGDGLGVRWRRMGERLFGRLPARAAGGAS